ncbi:histidine kinase [Ectothiorhodospira haloalkaliphila]|uniref:histidine kinase n=1 Tax=Ectothiorhodospira haloalkaliphila TaxID=421628 RepID=W8KS57_9GAMM|nr:MULTISPECIES: phosphate regulon sensor histidine kinase PhoR [Ectothiorhodospira]AHK79852.1 histidine kinase [Ectothiorhodospira haloalkaliphila]MCG5494161.1 phosphate regulon sensor histidine kinase PhoR [Ectothiorhodospira variabilis]MCG5497392.1 phosphate regulon sensor histidine kinase PhoR [Ectothiorhodospira variabilis]MCG5503309.1 phosphate regulon sensor histidine kinase PhoR [Ectothiorhodospira variabilis]MCG5506603.1 phosphate regulon sensor histidine kinase PhoR [Ectothiorhodospi
MIRDPHPWKLEAWRFGAVLTAGAMIGWWVGHVFATLFLAVLGFLGWHVFQLWRFHRWVRLGKRSDPPDTSGIWHDLTYDLYRLHQRSRKRKKKIARLLNRFHESSAAVPDATVILGKRYEIEWFNEAAGELLRLQQPGDVGRPITHLLREPRFIAYLEGGVYTQSLEMPRLPDRQVQLSARVVAYGDGQLLLTVRDVTRIHRLESMRRDFVANVSHELRTPLTVIAGYVETLVDDPTLAPEVHRTLQSVETQAERMRRIIDDLLTLSHLETREDTVAEQTAVPVPALIGAIEEDAHMLVAERDLTVHVEVEAGLWLRGARSELQSAFSNLVTNAIRYTPDGGTITLRWFADAEGARFQVEDTGIGIPQGQISRVTERFYRVESDRSRASGGTGLGLAIVKHVLQRHGATLHIQSIPDQGSTFTCHFPLNRTLQKPPSSNTLS